MGNFESTSPPPDGNDASGPDESDGPLTPSQEPLEPRLSPVGIFHQHTRNEETLLRVKMKSIMLMSADAANETGFEIFRFRESPLGVSKRLSE